MNDKKNPNGEGNYVFMEARGKGVFIGATQGIVQNQDDWFGEGDEMSPEHDDPSLSILGTGTEDVITGRGTSEANRLHIYTTVHPSLRISSGLGVATAFTDGTRKVLLRFKAQLR